MIITNCICKILFLSLLVNTNIMKNIIYGLADSRNDLIYYVGKSSVGSIRALSHLTKSHSPEVNKWIEEIESNWGRVDVILIEEVEDLLLLSEREKYWIGVHSTANENLLNKQSTTKHLADHYTEKDAEKFNELKRSLSFIGDIVKRRRLALDVPQAKLAEVSEVNRWTISQLESGRDVSLSSLRKILLGLTNLDICKQIVDTQIKERASK
jgi:hypothetical protein